MGKSQITKYQIKAQTSTMTNYVYIFRPSIGQYIKIKFYEVIIEARYRFVV